MVSSQQSNAARDATSLRLLGVFFCILGCLILFGTLWSLDNVRGMAVSLASGLVLTGIGGGMQMAARRLIRNEATKTPTTRDGDQAK